MEDVARRAGVSRVTVYRHFANKDGSLEAVVLREVRALPRRPGRSSSDSQTPRRTASSRASCSSSASCAATPSCSGCCEGEPELFLPQLTTEAGPMIAFARQLIADHVVGSLPHRVHPRGCPFTAGYWWFLDRNRERLSTNARMRRPVQGFDRLRDLAELVAQEQQRGNRAP